MRKLGIVAGAGDLPKLVIEACQKQGRPYFVLALKGHAEPATMTKDVPYTWFRLGAIGSMLDACHQNGVQDIVMIGAVKRPTVMEFRPDLRGLAFVAKVGMKSLGDDSLLKVIIKEIELEGFKVIGADEVLTDSLAKLGVYGKVKPSKHDWENIKKGFSAAKILGKADVGQGVVVGDGLVLSVEAIEGTDRLLKRTKELIRKNMRACLVKVKKPKQERRADLPTIGVQTIENAHAAGLNGIAVEKNSVFVVHVDKVVERANKLGLFLVGVDEKTCHEK